MMVEGIVDALVHATGLTAEQGKAVVGEIARLLLQQQDTGRALVERARSLGIIGSTSDWLAASDVTPISPEQTNRLLGQSVVDGIAGRLQVTAEKAASALGVAVPRVIAALAHDGALPATLPPWALALAPPLASVPLSSGATVADWAIRGIIFLVVVSGLWWIAQRMSAPGDITQAPAEANAPAAGGHGAAAPAAAGGHGVAAAAKSTDAKPTAPAPTQPVAAPSSASSATAPGPAPAPAPAGGHAAAAPPAAPTAPAAPASPAAPAPADAAKAGAAQGGSASSASPAPVATAQAASTLDLQRDAGGKVTYGGSVSDSGTRAGVIALLTAAFGRDNLSGSLAVDPKAGPAAWLPGLRKLADQLKASTGPFALGLEAVALKLRTLPNGFDPKAVDGLTTTLPDGTTVTEATAIPGGEARPGAELDSDTVMSALDSMRPEQTSIEDLTRTLSLLSIGFVTGSAEIPEREQRVLAKSVAFFKTLPASVRIEIQGHTDNQGSEAVNEPLSRDRATAVRDLLVRDGASESLFVVKGFGATHPVASNDTAEGRARNRRIEYVVLAR